MQNTGYERTDCTLHDPATRSMQRHDRPTWPVLLSAVIPLNDDGQRPWDLQLLHEHWLSGVWIELEKKIANDMTVDMMNMNTASF